MISHSRILGAACLGLVVLAAAASPLQGQRVTATRASAGLRLDGVLDEQSWAGAEPATEFVQREPVEGVPASERTEVRFLYDDDALWVGARMFSADPTAIRSLLTRRDREGVSEQIVISLDTYRDRRTAYSFGVTPTGVRIDYYHPSDFEDARDYGWDPVWEVETAIDERGWTAELRIPLTQLRFDAAADQVWGLNVVRHIPERNEVSYWLLVRREETGWSSRMGELAGLVALRPSRGVEALPYVVGSAALTDVADANDPFEDPRSTHGRAGGDLKVQLGSSLTLDATFNPDFGQVEADPAEVNLTAFETFFGERRPFFLENSSLFGGRGFFYSRRIGGPPPIAAGSDYAEPLDNTTILGAAKLAGRLSSGLSIGALGAVTGREEVATYDDAAGAFGRAQVAPFTSYGVVTVQRQFGADASTLGATVTSVHRNLEPGSSLAAAVTEDALSGLVDLRIRWAGGKYDLATWLGTTYVRGSTDALLSLQRSSRRYWQRPDASHVEVDPTRTSMTGTVFGIGHSKLSGTHWLWDIDLTQESPGLEPNDIGQLGGTDDRGFSAHLRYQETVPGSLFRSWAVGISHFTEWTFGGEREFSSFNPYVDFTLPNFWRVSLGGGQSLGGLSDVLTRGGPLMEVAPVAEAYFELENSSGARTGWGISGVVNRDEAGSHVLRISPSLSLRPGENWELTLDPRWLHRVDARQYVTARDGGPTATFGRRYIFAELDRSEVSARVRLNYTFTPTLTLESYLEPFASSGRYSAFGELPAPRSGDLRAYGEGGTTITAAPDGSRRVTADGETFTLADRDFNVRSLRTNLVLRWEWRLGSTAYLVWQQDGSAERERGTVRPMDVLDAFQDGVDHFFALKVSYWIPIR